MAPEPFNELRIAIQAQLKLFGYCGHLLKYFDSKKTHLEDMIKRTAVMSESNSVLIVGPRGSGKSALLGCVIQKTFEDSAVKGNMLLVSLDGLIHTNDNLALEEIGKQLKMGNNEDKELGSFSEKLSLLLSALKSGNKKSKSVLFVLDNFDLFCTHKNQTLLYNLFDIAQSQHSPICVVGMSCRSDVLQVLENRVYSRFSHQKILLFEEMTFSEYVECAKEFLSLHNFENTKFLKRWNNQVAALLKENDIKKILEHHFNNANTLRELKRLLFLTIQNIKSSHPSLTVEDFKEADWLCTPHSKSIILRDLSVLELALVIAMMHLTEIYDGEPFNFEMVYNELEKYFKKKKMWNLEKPVVMKAFEHLWDLELIKACVESSTNVLKRYMLVRLLVDCSEIKEAVENYQNIPLQLKHWAQSSIDG